MTPHHHTQFMRVCVVVCASVQVLTSVSIHGHANFSSTTHPSISSQDMARVSVPSTAWHLSHACHRLITNVCPPVSVFQLHLILRGADRLTDDPSRHPLLQDTHCPPPRMSCRVAPLLQGGLFDERGHVQRRHPRSHLGESGESACLGCHHGLHLPR